MFHFSQAFSCRADESDSAGASLIAYDGERCDARVSDPAMCGALDYCPTRLCSVQKTC